MAMDNTLGTILFALMAMLVLGLIATKVTKIKVQLKTEGGKFTS